MILGDLCVSGGTVIKCEHRLNRLSKAFPGLPLAIVFTWVLLCSIISILSVLPFVVRI